MQFANGEDMARIGQMLCGSKVSSMDAGEIEKEMKAMIDKALKGNEQVMDMANLVYARSELDEDIRKKLIELFQLNAVKVIPELEKDGPAIINADVSQATRGKIQQIVGGIDPDTVRILINAIYFNGKWAKAFDKEDTKKEDFKTESNGVKKVWMMHQRKSMYYYSCPVLKAQAVLLPYKDSSIQMMILLPDEGVPLTQVAKHLNGELMTQIVSRMHWEETVLLWLPRFKIESDHNLEKLFGGFENRKPDVWLTKAMQKAMVEVDEEGTIAAAVTRMDFGVMRCSIPRRPPPPKIVRCDRPFLYFLIINENKNYRDQKSPLVLFAGAVCDPPQV